MKWFLSFIVMGIFCTVIYMVILGFIVMGIDKAIGGHSLILEAVQKAAAIVLGFYSSYKFWPPKKTAAAGQDRPSEEAPANEAEAPAADEER